ncbi:glutamate--cysteine ligase [Streptomyces sp. RS10V-4]|uniref:carboxylate-amine ligase n=1 Tax=Streptomyces rhizoryzae TaxID=2932493 RepID=UPI002004DBB3|nr:glutamate--cysteine ligase [Streptomyces rhizoryzae]MCK7624464.1 glutamate--cysteine ligase [Streptomyces rhizoryzae]
MDPLSPDSAPVPGELIRPGTAPASVSRAGPMTIGVEEEFLLIDPETRLLAPVADAVIAKAAPALGDHVTPELTRYQVETRTDPHTSLAALAEQLHATRRQVAEAAATSGARLVSSGAPVLLPAGPPPLTSGERYARSAAQFGALDDEQVACACHIHLGFDDRDLALRVSNHLRVWLPALITVAANSPFWDGRDTGYASWRNIAWNRWPVAGPPPHFASTGHYDDLVATLIGTGAVLDHRGVYWDIRPSHHLPTLEVRVADAAPTVDHTVLLAGLVRAAAATALESVRRGEPAPQPDPHLLRAACWRAARHGLAGHAVNLTHHALEPTQRHLRDFLTWLRSALSRHGDLRHVETLTAHLHRHGTGAAYQHRAYRRRQRLTDIVDDLVTRTLSPPLPRGTARA